MVFDRIGWQPSDYRTEVTIEKIIFLLMSIELDMNKKAAE